MTTDYNYFERSPPGDDDANALALDDAISTILRHFPTAEFDEHSRLVSLQALGAPKEIIELYKNPKVTRVRITRPNLEGRYVEFDLWHNQGVMVYAKPDESKLADCELLVPLHRSGRSSALGFRYLTCGHSVTGRVMWPETD